MKLDTCAYVGTVLTLTLIFVVVCCDQVTCTQLHSKVKIEKRSIVPRSLHALIEKMQSHQLSQRGMRLRRLQPSEFLGKRSVKNGLVWHWNLPETNRANEMLGKRSSLLLSGPLSQDATNSDEVWYSGRSRRGPNRLYLGNEFLGKRSDGSSSISKSQIEN